MVWEFMLSFMPPTDFEILQPSYHSSIESLSLCRIRKRRPTKLFHRSVLLRLTSKNIGSALPASQKSGQRSNNEAMPVIREGVCVWSGIPCSFSQNWTEGSFLKISLEKKPQTPQLELDLLQQKVFWERCLQKKLGSAGIPLITWMIGKYRPVAISLDPEGCSYVCPLLSLQNRSLCESSVRVRFSSVTCRLIPR